MLNDEAFNIKSSSGIDEFLIFKYSFKIKINSIFKSWIQHSSVKKKTKIYSLIAYSFNYFMQKSKTQMIMTLNLVANTYSGEWIGPLKHINWI